MQELTQGVLLSVENISFPVLVVSKDFFNQTEQVIVCPVPSQAKPDPLHIPVQSKDVQGVVLCEQLKFLDLRLRGYKKLSEISKSSIMDITYAIQGIFDYV